MAPNASDGSDNKIFDVTKPGKTAASANSRPTIVGHGPLLSDPMVLKSSPAPDTKTSETNDEDKPTGGPLVLQAAETEALPKSHAAKIDEPDEYPNEKVEEKPELTSPQVFTPNSVPESQDNPEPPPQSEAAISEQAKEAEKTKQAAIKEMTVNKKYFVPIGEKTRKKRSLRHTLIGAALIIVLGLLLTDMLMDVGIIKTSIQPPIRVFSHK